MQYHKIQESQNKRNDEKINLKKRQEIQGNHWTDLKEQQHINELKCKTRHYNTRKDKRNTERTRNQNIRT